MGLYYLQSRYYDPERCRFHNADAYISTGQGTLGNNMFAYCENSPVLYYDPSGTYKDVKRLFCYDMMSAESGCGGGYIPSRRKNGISWCSDIFGAGVLQSNEYEAFSVDTLFFGAETGLSTSQTILGDVSKPVSVFVTNASKWWKFTEYKAGTQFNIAEGGLSIAHGLGETSIGVSFGKGTTIEFMSGIDKIGMTVSQGADFGNQTADMYYHVYIRSIPTAALAVALVYAQQMVLILLPTLAPG